MMRVIGHVLCRALELEVEGQRKSWMMKWTWYRNVMMRVIGHVS